MVSLAAFSNELEKVGARAGLKIIRRLLEGAEPTAVNLAKAERIATTPGVLKKTMQGSQIRDLGTGLEGVSTLVAHPKKGITVRKLYDTPTDQGLWGRFKDIVSGTKRSPGGMSTGKMIDRKEQFAKEMQGAMGLPQYHGAATLPSGKRMQFSQFVPGESYKERLLKGIEEKKKGGAIAPIREAKADLEQVSPIGPEMRRLHQQAEHRGYRLEDVGMGNVQVTRGKGGKAHATAIDVLPFRDPEVPSDLLNTKRVKQMHAGAAKAEKLSPSSPKSSPLHPHSQERTNQIKREAFGTERDSPFTSLDPNQAILRGRRG